LAQWVSYSSPAFAPRGLSVAPTRDRKRTFLLSGR
jgi:hypothetical protein